MDDLEWTFKAEVVSFRSLFSLYYNHWKWKCISILTEHNKIGVKLKRLRSSTQEYIEWTFQLFQYPEKTGNEH